MKKLSTILIASLLIFGISGCSKDIEQGSVEKNDNTQTEANENKNQETEKEVEYLVSKYLELEKGLDYENIKSKLSKDKIEINDSGEFDAPAGYKKREVSFVDGDNKLDLVFRDNKLASKTFTYDKDETNSSWFYSNYYDILDNTDEKSEAHGIWKNSITQIECTDEYDMIIKVQDEL